jgi:hypothetical protein
MTNTAWVRARLCILQKGCTRLAAASDEAYQLLAHGRLFSPGTPVSSTTYTGHHDIAEMLLKVPLKHQRSKSSKIIILERIINLIVHLLAVLLTSERIINIIVNFLAIPLTSERIINIIVNLLAVSLHRSVLLI